MIFTAQNSIGLLGLLSFTQELAGKDGYLSLLNRHIKLKWNRSLAILSTTETGRHFNIQEKSSYLPAHVIESIIKGA